MCAERVSVSGNMRRVSVGLIPSRLFSSFDGFHFQSRDKMATFHVLTESTLWIHVNSFLPGVPTWTIEYECCHTEDKSETDSETSAMKSIPGTLPRLAVRQRDFETLKRLYYLNSQPQYRRIPMFWFQSAKHHAASEGNLELLQWLHEHTTENCRSDTMANAARNGHVAVVRWLQRHCPKSQTSMNCHVMDDAARSGLLDIVRVLHEERSEGCTTLAMDNAASNGHLEVVKYLHENRTEGCSSDAIDGAATNGHLGVLEWLLEHRSDHFTKNASIGAASNGHLDVLRLLWNHQKCETDIVDEGFRLAILHAATKGNLAIVQFCLDECPAVFPMYVMTRAALNGHLEVVKLLHLTRPREDIDEALVHAAKYHPSIVDYLLENDEFSTSVLKNALKRSLTLSTSIALHLRMHPERDQSNAFLPFTSIPPFSKAHTRRSGPSRSSVSSRMRRLAIRS